MLLIKKLYSKERWLEKCWLMKGNTDKWDHCVDSHYRRLYNEYLHRLHRESLAPMQSYVLYNNIFYQWWIFYTTADTNIFLLNMRDRWGLVRVHVQSLEKVQELARFQILTMGFLFCRVWAGSDWWSNSVLCRWSLIVGSPQGLVCLKGLTLSLQCSNNHKNHITKFLTRQSVIKQDVTMLKRQCWTISTCQHSLFLKKILALLALMRGLLNQNQCSPHWWLDEEQIYIFYLYLQKVMLICIKSYKRSQQIVYSKGSDSI